MGVIPTPVEALEAFGRLYATFVSEGDVVFDIGANIGENVGLFAELGARVVAVEPLRECLPFIREAGGDRVEIVHAAVGAHPGELTMHVCDRAWDISSASTEWIDTMRAADMVGDGKVWGEQRVVPMTTVDELIARHGVPAFLKVDVEGFEHDVLRGLSHAVGAVSFESHAALAGKSRACVARLHDLGFEHFSSSPGHTAKLSPWTDVAGVGEAIDAMAWGDVYATFRPPGASAA